MKKINLPIKSGASRMCGSIVGEETGGGNLRLYKTCAPADSIIIERANLDDLMVVLDALLGQR